MKKYLPILLVVSFALNAGIFKLWRGERSEKLRHKANQQSLLDQATYYRTKDSLSAASVQRLELEKKELIEIVWVKEDIIQSLNLKANRLLAASKTATKTEADIETPVIEKIIYKDSEPYKVNCLEYKDPYLELSGCLIEGDFKGKIKSYDTLIQAVHRIPRMFLGIIPHGTKAIRQEILSKNPYTEIVYTEYIELKKRRR